MSDTESDDSFPGTAYSVSELIASRKHPEDATGSCAERALAATQTLLSMDPNAVSHNVGMHGDIQRASSDILTFLGSLTTPPSEQDVNVICSSLGAIVRFSFLGTLFKYRKNFHGIASRALSPGVSSSAVISWVDFILAKLGDVIVIVAAGFQAEAFPTMPCILQRQRDEDGLWAASQLPEKWESIPFVLTSDHASPAAKRLSLRLIFAAHMMASELEGPDLWTDSGIPHVALLGSLEIYSKQLSLAIGESIASHATNDPGLQERISYSMIVSLYGHFDRLDWKAKEADQTLRIRPHSLSALLSLIQEVIHSDRALLVPKHVLPLEILDPAQTILLRWGQTVPWCWSTWNDSRVAQVECLTTMTATWIYHLELFPIESDESIPAFPARALACMRQDTMSCIAAILQVLYHSVFLLNSSISHREGIGARCLVVLHKSCLVVLALATLHTDSRHLELRLSLCKSLCALFVLLQGIEGAVRVQEVIIEILALNDNSTVQDALSQLREDTKICFTTKLDKALSACRALLLDTPGHATAEDGRPRHVKVMLDFLTIVWYSGVQGLLQTETITDLFSSLAAQLETSSPHGSMLLDTFLITLATVEILRATASFGDVNKVWQDDMLWQLSVQFRCSDLFGAAAFANYVLAANRIGTAIRCAQAWSYLRDVLLMILTRQFLGDDEPLALLICPVVCRALVFLVSRADSATVCFVLSSPWTINLCAALRDLVHEDNNGNGNDNDNGNDCNDEGGFSAAAQYRAVLKGRLTEMGKLLLDQISKAIHPDNSDPSEGAVRRFPGLLLGSVVRANFEAKTSAVPAPPKQQRLLFFRAHDVTRLSLVP